MKHLLYILFLTYSIVANAQTLNLQGNGTLENPWQISTPEHLAALATYVNLGGTTSEKHIRMMNNIDLSEWLRYNAEGWIPVGINGSSFNGFFHGSGHIISGLRINRPELGDCGLFGNLQGAIIDSLGIEVAENDSIKGEDATGILAGRVGNFTKISRCYVKGMVVGGANVGGFVGRFEDSYLENCYAIVDVKSHNPVWSFAGGLIGYKNNSVDTITGITYCYAKGTAKSAGNYVGGLVGYSRNTQGRGSNDRIENSVSITSEISGGFAGKVGHSYAENTYACENTELDTDDTCINGISKPHKQLQNQDFYTNPTHWKYAPWDFENVWTMSDDEDYLFPVFNWQRKRSSCIPFEQVVRVRWNNTLIAINNPENNGGYTFTSYKWYQNDNHICSQQWWTAGQNGELLSTTDRYRLEFTAYGTDQTLYTCESTITLRAIHFSAYPNPVEQHQTLYVEVDLDEHLLKDAVIEIYTVSGQLVETLPAQPQTQIHIKYSQGYHFVVLKGKDDLQQNLKILIK